MRLDLPPDLEHVRTTPTFTEESVPAGLLGAHRVATGVWGRLVVHSGALVFRFEDEADLGHEVSEGESLVIPPDRLHHVEVDGPVTFVVEFHRASR